jgi:flagellar motility protein MotE (MotC chaperone)
VLLWIAILGLCIKLDVGGFGSDVMYPVLKNVPVVNKILPNVKSDIEYSEEYPYATLADALEQIKALELEISNLQEQGEADAQTISDLEAEVSRLKQFEDNQVAFQELKDEFYEEVVFGDGALDIEEYQKYYESIEPENAEQLYKQVIKTETTDEEIEQYAAAYSAMKPAQAAGIFESMTDDLELAGEILWAMDSDSRGKILGAMDADIAAKITKIMEP